jgi:hypothetical protein
MLGALHYSERGIGFWANGQPNSPFWNGLGSIRLGGHIEPARFKGA